MIRTAVLGCGRIGAGIGWREWKPPYLYDHASAYLALKDRVRLEWVYDPDPAKAHEAGDKLGVRPIAGGDMWAATLAAALKAYPVDLVSICTPPEARGRLIPLLGEYGTIRGAWIEKPLAVTDWPRHWKINVNYIRRADRIHRLISTLGGNERLWVWAKKDTHTVCHFTDLARFWNIPKEGLRYFPMDGPNSYLLERGESPKEFFPLGGIEEGSDFMVQALGNLLDAMEGKAELWSPPESAVESERWADEILREP